MQDYKRYILDSQEKIINVAIKKRDFYFDRELLSLHKIISFVGPRRAGKTYTMYQVLRDLIQEQVLQKEQIVFIDFSEFIEKQVDFLKILESFYELFPDKEPFFVFDEIQEIENFRQ
jgi:predicted AAA+ superfamily ATPase